MELITNQKLIGCEKIAIHNFFVIKLLVCCDL